MPLDFRLRTRSQALRPDLAPGTPCGPAGGGHSGTRPLGRTGWRGGCGWRQQRGKLLSRSLRPTAECPLNPTEDVNFERTASVGQEEMDQNLHVSSSGAPTRRTPRGSISQRGYEFRKRPSLWRRPGLFSTVAWAARWVLGTRPSMTTASPCDFHPGASAQSREPRFCSRSPAV